MAGAARHGVRTRPVDVARALNIVLDEVDLDVEESSRTPSAEKLDKAGNEDGKPIFIPVPPVTDVPTYAVDYLPIHTVLLTHQKAPHDGGEVWASQWQEYDLDEEDLAFLNEVNQGGTQERITWAQLETMLWHLEVQNSEASERSLQGAQASERSNAAAVYTTEHLSEAAAMETLSDCVECQHYLRHRVHEFWRAKRKRAHKPSLRRLQAPTPEADANPYLVFRQRAKPNKPLTRRRRETQEESLDKINLILRNLDHVAKLATLVRERETSKSYLTNHFVDTAQYQLLSVLQEVPQSELDQRLLDSCKGCFKRNEFKPQALPKAGDVVPVVGSKRGPPGPPIAEAARPNRKTKRGTTDLKAQAIKAHPPPPSPMRPQVCCLDQPLDGLHNDETVRTHMDGDLIDMLERGTVRMRIGRLRRVLLDPVELADEGEEEPTEAAQNGTDLAAKGGAAWSTELQRLKRLMEL